MLFWRDVDGWAGPATVTRIGEFDVGILHNLGETISDKYRVCPVPQRIPVNEMGVIDTNQEVTPEQHEHESLEPALVSPTANATRTPFQRNRRGKAERLAEENRNIIEEPPPKRTTNMTASRHEITYASSCQPSPPPADLTVEEKIIA